MLIGFPLSFHFIRDGLNLRTDLVQLKRVSTVDVGERWRSAPATVEQLTVCRYPIGVAGRGVSCDLQKALGKTQGRAPCTPRALPAGVATPSRLERSTDHSCCFLAVLSVPAHELKRRARA